MTSRGGIGLDPQSSNGVEGIEETVFCELDFHLQPWDKNSNRKDRLVELYDAARVWVYGDFLLQSPEKPAEWPANRAANH